MRVVFMGTPEIAVPSLEGLLRNRYQVVAVYTQPDRAAGRGRKVSVSPVKQTALNWNIPVEQPDSLQENSVRLKLSAYKPDVIVVAAYAQLLPKEVLDIPAHSCINIHPSLLPRHRGSSPVAAAILAGDELTGVSIMKMSKGLDTGPVLAQAQIAISSLDTTGSLTVKLSLVSAQLLLEVLPYWLGGEIKPRPQDKSGASYLGEFSKKDGEIDWNLPAINIWRRVRAFHPWPGCYTRWQGKQIKIIEAMPLPAEGAFPAGQTLSVNKEGVVLGINTGDGVLGILVLQMEGKRAMSADEFLRGQRNFIGTILPSD